MARLTLSRLLLIACFAWSHNALAQADDLRLAEKDIQAGLLYTFLRYTEWPGASDDAETVICLYNLDSFGGRLSPLIGRTVNHRTIDVRVVHTPDQARHCALLFLPVSNARAWQSVRSALIGKSVLTVSEYPGFANDGGMIEFTRIGNKVSLTLNDSAISDARLSVGEGLLRLVRSARGDVLSARP